MYSQQKPEYAILKIQSCFDSSSNKPKLFVSNNPILKCLKLELTLQWSKVCETSLQLKFRSSFFIVEPNRFSFLFRFINPFLVVCLLRFLLFSLISPHTKHDYLWQVKKFFLFHSNIFQFISFHLMWAFFSLHTREYFPIFLVHVFIVWCCPRSNLMFFFSTSFSILLFSSFLFLFFVDETFLRFLNF